MLRSAKGALIALTALALVAVPASAQDNVAGNWTLTVSSPDMGDVGFQVMLEQDGTEVSGTATAAMPEIEGTEITDGVLEDGVLFFLLHVGAQGQWITVEMEADVDGDEMVGEAYVAEMGQAVPFKGVRND